MSICDLCNKKDCETRKRNLDMTYCSEYEDKPLTDSESTTAGIIKQSEGK